MEPRVFFFANLRARGPARGLFKTFSILGAVGTLFYMLAIAWWSKMKVSPLTFLGEWSAGRWGSETQDEPETEAQRRIREARDEERERNRRRWEEMDEGVRQRYRQLPSGSNVRWDNVRWDRTRINESAVEMAEVPTNVSTLAFVGTPEMPQLSGISTRFIPKRIYEREMAKASLLPRWLKARTGLVAVVFFVTSSELQLRWNHLIGIDSLSTTGQIIPLTIGLLSLVRVTYLLRELHLVAFLWVMSLPIIELWTLGHLIIRAVKVFCGHPYYDRDDNLELAVG